MKGQGQAIAAVFFDLDGTLYCSPELDAAYHRCYCQHLLRAVERRRAAGAASAAAAGVAGGADEPEAALASVLACFEANFGFRPAWSTLLPTFGLNLRAWHLALRRGVDPAHFLGPDRRLAAALADVRAGAPLAVEAGGDGGPAGDGRPAGGARGAGRRTVAVVTNNSAGLAARTLDALGVAGLFDFIVVPRGLADLKPSPAMYRRALRRAEVAPSKSLVVGDRWDIDLVPAAALGMAVHQASGTAAIAALLDGRPIVALGEGVHL